LTIFVSTTPAAPPSSPSATLTLLAVVFAVIVGYAADGLWLNEIAVDIARLVVGIVFQPTVNGIISHGYQLRPLNVIHFRVSVVE